MSNIAIGYIGLIVVFLLIFMRMPIAFAFGIVGFAGLWFLRDMEPALGSLALEPYATLTNYVWTVVPVFVYMGYMAYHTGMARDFYAGIHRWVGHFRGGLAMAVILGNTAFGACTGDPVSAAVTFSSMSLPEMRKYKYADSLTLGSVAAGGTLAALIPPSLGFIIYGAIAEVSIGQLFIAGIIPGLVLTALFLCVIVILCARNPAIGPAIPRATWPERWKASGGMWTFIIVFVGILGGIFAGVFTPTEAGAFGAFLVLALGLARRRLSWKGFKEGSVEAGVTIGMVGILLVGCLIFNKFLAVSGMPQAIARFIGGVAQSPLETLWIIVVIYLIMGCFIDALSITLLTVPIFYPVIVHAGIDPIHFGVVLTVSMIIGTLTPPFGIIVYAMKGAVKDVPLFTIFRGTYPFIFAMIVLVALVIHIPLMSTWLPALMITNR